ncbi:MAG TPA: class I SAM-dependent methyltransferase [Gemmatimonadales bacterium]|nr:class I SAM-dependent methyltransferase [Gemmatimonadales bacterium]
MKSPRFEDLTETTGIPLSAEGAEMMYTRYAAGAELARGKRVLEIGCGAGQGLALLSRSAKLVVGGDYSMALLRSGRAHYGDLQRLVRMTAEDLPFREASFDVVLFFEASYYVPRMTSAFDELTRIVAPGGTVLFVNANPERPDFITSPHSTHYHTAAEFRSELERRGFVVSVEGAFPVEPPATGVVAQLKGLALRLARTVLEALHLVPRTLRGRARLKRLVYGKLIEVPAELPEGFAPVAQRAPIGTGPVTSFKVLYVTAVKPPV